MKQTLLIVLLSTFSFSGFYDSTDEVSSKKSEYAENVRLCKMFAKKVEEYKSTMRNGTLAISTLASHEHKTSIYCKKAEEAKKSH